MIVHESIDHHAEHLFPVLIEQVEATVQFAFAMGLLQIHEALCLKLGAAVSKAVEEMIKDKEPDPVIRQTTPGTLNSESVVGNIS